MSILSKFAQVFNIILKPFDIRVSRLSTETKRLNMTNVAPRLSEDKDPLLTPEIQIREVEIQFPPETWVMMQTPSKGNLWIDLGDLGVSRGCLKGNYEATETSFVENVLQPGDTFLDIGANIGWFTITAANIVGAEGRVYAFEPRNTTFKYLEKTISSNDLNPRVQAFHCALGAEKGTLQIVWGTGTSNPGGTWLVSRKEVSDVLPTTTHTYQDIDVQRLDDVVNVSRVDVIKIDVEGAEPLVLQGAETILRNCRPLVLSEINEELLKIVGNSSGKQFIEWMKNFDYECFEITDRGIGVQFYDEATVVNDLPAVVNVLFVPIGYDKTKLIY